MTERLSFTNSNLRAFEPDSPEFIRMLASLRRGYSILVSASYPHRLDVGELVSRDVGKWSRTKAGSIPAPM